MSEVCPLKILIIEDDVNIARLIELELGYEGYQVSVAHDGNIGLDLFKKDQPDLVLLDVMLPGLERYRSLQKTAQYVQSPCNYAYQPKMA